MPIAAEPFARLARRRGVSAISYALLLGLASLSAVGAVSLLGDGAASVFRGLADELDQGAGANDPVLDLPACDPDTERLLADGQSLYCAPLPATLVIPTCDPASERLMADGETLSCAPLPTALAIPTCDPATQRLMADGAALSCVALADQTLNSLSRTAGSAEGANAMAAALDMGQQAIINAGAITALGPVKATAVQIGETPAAEDLARIDFVQDAITTALAGGSSVDWSQLTGVPSGLDNGDDVGITSLSGQDGITISGSGSSRTIGLSVGQGTIGGLTICTDENSDGDGLQDEAPCVAAARSFDNSSAVTRTDNLQHRPLVCARTGAAQSNTTLAWRNNSWDNWVGSWQNCVDGTAVILTVPVDEIP